MFARHRRFQAKRSFGRTANVLLVYVRVALLTFVFLLACSTAFGRQGPQTEASQQPGPAPHIYVARKLTVRVSYKRLIVDIEVSYRRNDQGPSRLIRGDQSFPDFINDLLGTDQSEPNKYFGIVGTSPDDLYPISSLFIGSNPVIKVDGDSITITGSSNPKNQVVLPSRNGILTFHLPKDFSNSQYDWFSLQIEGYETTSLNPMPTHLNDVRWYNGHATWTGADPDLKQTGAIQCGVKYRALKHAQNFFHFIPLSAWETVPYPYVIGLSIAWGVLLTIPLLWLLAIYRETAPVNKAVEWMCLLLGSAAFIAPLIDLLLVSNILFWSVLLLVLGAPPLYGVRRFRAETAENVQGWGLVLLQLAVMLSGAWILVFISALLIELLTLSAALIGCAVVAIVLAWPAYVFVVRLLALTWRKKLAIAAAVSLPLVLVAYSLSGGSDTFWYFTEISDANVAAFSLSKIGYLFTVLAPLVLYITFLGILSVSKQLSETSTANTSLDSLQKLMFAAYIAGATWHFYLIPIPFLLALAAYRRVLTPSRDNRSADAVALNEIATPDPDLSRIDLDVLRDSKRSLEKKLRTAEITPEVFSVQNEKLERVISRIEEEKTCRTALDFSNKWNTAKRAMFRVIGLALLFAPIYVGIAVLRDGSVQRYFVVSLFVIVTGGIGDLLIMGFFFAYTFNDIKASSGLRKGILVAVASIGCIFPVLIITFSFSPVLIALYVVPYLMFLPLLGILAFDLERLKNEKHPWRSLIQLEKLPTFLAFSSIPITSVILAVITLLTGGYKEIVSALLKLASVVPEIPHK